MVNDFYGETINVVYMDMAPGIPEQITLNHDGSYTVFLNARYSFEYLQQAMAHALEHVRRADHYKGLPADQIESEVRDAGSRLCKGFNK